MKNLSVLIAFSILATGLETKKQVSLDFTPGHTGSGVAISFNLRSIPTNKTDTMTTLKLLHAEKIAAQLFETVERNNLIVAGKSEEELNNEVSTLALEKFGVQKTWHKKIVRSGINTLSIYNDNPPNRILQKDDIVFIDFGIIVDGWSLILPERTCWATTPGS